MGMAREGKGGPPRLRALAIGAALFLGLSAQAILPEVLDAHGVNDPQDDILRAVGVDENPGGRVPKDAVFRDERGLEVRLGDYLGEGPVLLTLNYYTCPMLCPLTLRNLLGSVEEVRGIGLGSDFRIVTVSIDPEDGPKTASARAGEIHSEMGGIGDPAGRWPFLTGDGKAIDALAGAVGFRYKKVGKEYAHPDVVVVLTPEGRISRYLYGIEHDPVDLKLALIEAADGNIGESVALNRILLYCFHYDPVGKKYALYARNVMKAGGVLTLALLGGLYLLLWRRGKAGDTP